LCAVWRSHAARKGRWRKDWWSSAGVEAILDAVYMREYFIDDLPKYENVKFAGVLSLLVLC
jgi:hypothetical protein